MPEILIGETPFYYRVSERAPDSAPVMICLHGSGTDSVVWSYQISRLSRFARMVIVDLPGHGRSGGAVPAGVEEYAQWLEQLRQRLDFGRFFLVGHSLGGAIAQTYARLHSGRVRGMVLASTGTHFRLSRAYHELKDRSPGDLTKGSIPEHLQGAYQMLLTLGDRGALLADMPAAAAFDSRPWAADIRIPAVVVCGSADIITPRDLAEELEQKLPQATLEIIEGAGHVLMLEKPSEFNDVVRAFVDNVLRTE